MSLSKLIEAVEAGTLHPDDDWDFLCDLFPMSQAEKDAGDYESDEVANIRNAFHGSLDAAKRLHDALLPGWGWETGANATFASIAQVWKSGRDKAHVATSETPARAFLLAILRALEQEGRE